MRTPFAHALDQAMAIEHGINGSFGRNPDIACQPPEQELADLACAPMRLFPFEGDNQALDLLGQLVGITHWSPRAIAESLTTMLPVAVENLVAGFTRYPELPAHIRHRLPIRALTWGLGAGSTKRVQSVRHSGHDHRQPRASVRLTCEEGASRFHEAVEIVLKAW